MIHISGYGIFILRQKFEGKSPVLEHDIFDVGIANEFVVLVSEARC